MQRTEGTAQRGRPGCVPHHDEEPVRLPVDWSMRRSMMSKGTCAWRSARCVLLIACLGVPIDAVAQAPDPGLVGLPIVTPPPVVGDVDNNGVVTCRDIALATKAIGTRLGQVGFMPRADVDGNGVIDVRD